MIATLPFALVLGVLAAFCLGWYLCREAYAPRITELEGWVLKLINDYSDVTDTALHMKKSGEFVVDERHEAAKLEPKMPVIDGDLGAFIDRIEHPDAREIALARSRQALMEGMDSYTILEHLRAGDDPLWARSIGE